MRRVVVLDDCYVDRLAIETVLAGDRWIVETCKRSMEFHLRVLAADTDVWIVSYELGGLETGLQVISNLRCAGVEKVPVIMLSGEPAVEEKCDAGGNIFFLHKEKIHLIPQMVDRILGASQQLPMQPISMSAYTNA